MAEILLLNGESVQVVCMARALHRLGHEVSSLSHTKCSSGYATRWVDHKYKCPEPVAHAEEYRKYFYDHIMSHKYDLIIPMLDEGADFLSREKASVEKFGIRVAIENYETFQKANDKQKLMELCREYGLPHPRTEELVKENLNKAAEYVRFPAMIKPNVSAGAKGIVKVENMKELEEKFYGIEDRFGQCTLQQYVEQPKYYYNVMLFRTKAGKTAAYTVIKIKRFFPLKGGSSCYSETVEHPFLVQQCEHCLEKLNWHGFADFDVLEDKNTGELKIIEINPRVPSSLQASFAAGINYAEVFVEEYIGGGINNKEYKYKAGQQVRWFGLDVLWFLMSPERFSYRPSWFRFWGKNVSYHDGCWRDPLPMIAGCLQGVVKYLNPSFRQAKLKG